MLSGIMTVLPCFCRTQKLAAMTFEMNATQAALALLGLIFFVVLAIQLFRYSARKTHASRKILRDHRWARHRSLSLNIGFTVAIAVAGSCEDKEGRSSCVSIFVYLPRTV